jgi:hypothetical protein
VTTIVVATAAAAVIIYLFICIFVVYDFMIQASTSL